MQAPFLAERTMDSNFLALAGATAGASLVGVLLGLYVFRRRPAGDGDVALARLEEKEKSLVEQLEKAKSQLDDLLAVKERLAASEEKILGLERENARERELARMLEERLQNEASEERVVRDALQGELAEQSGKLAAAESLESELRAQLKRAGDHISQRDTLVAGLREGMEELRGTVAARESELAVAREREISLNRSVTERDEQLKGLQEQLKTEFENIANKVLSSATGQLTEKSQESLATILEPLRTRITEFQQRVETAHLEDTRQRSILGEQIRLSAQANQSIGQQAENLAKALKGDSQMRGRWGEHKLELILEKSGLVKGRDFVVQGSGLNIRSEEGGSQRPDVIVFLPEDRHLIIDSKVSLVDYLEYEAAETDEARANCFRKLAASVRGHIDDLAGKAYQRADSVNSLEFVLMFVPIDSVFVLVTQNEPSLREYAWQRGIIMVPPSTLFVTMETVASVWRLQRQNENAREIAEKAGQLFDKLAAIVCDLNDVHEKIQAAARAHNEAMRKLATGRGNALSRAQQLKGLGVSSKKELPPVLIDGGRHMATDGEDAVELSELQAAIPRLLENRDPG